MYLEGRKYIQLSISINYYIELIFVFYILYLNWILYLILNTIYEKYYIQKSARRDLHEIPSRFIYSCKEKTDQDFGKGPFTNIYLWHENAEIDYAYRNQNDILMMRQSSQSEQMQFFWNT